MEQVSWGIIGCGDVTEIKSGPAFNKVDHSRLAAVMRRNAEKAEDYARRHSVPKWFNNANDLINDPTVNAIYVATPPDSHEEYTIAALQAGKPVYVEKPMSTDADSASRMARAASATGQKLVVAHYRRAQPQFLQIKSWLEEGMIGKVQLARLSMLKRPFSKDDILHPSRGWRVNPEIGGGGLFHDLAPHQLDLLCFFFGNPLQATGMAFNQSGTYAADDVVSGQIRFENDVLFNGLWAFQVTGEPEMDRCVISGDKGTIAFSFFDQSPVVLTRDGKSTQHSFPPLQHVQQPMIARTVDYFLGHGPNPCGAMEGVRVMKLIDAFTRKNENTNE